MMADSKNLGLGALIIVLAIGYLAISKTNTNYSSTNIKPTEIKPLTPEVIQKNRQFQVAAGTLLAYKKHLNDPDSFVAETITANKDASIICLVYRAKNGFGGYVRHTIVFKSLLPMDSEKTWNKECMSNPINSDDITYVKDSI